MIDETSNLEYAGFWIRTVAVFIDYLLIAVLPTLSIIILLLMSIDGLVEIPLSVKQMQVAPQYISWGLLLGSIVYFSLLPTTRWGGTCGKRILKLRIRRANNCVNMTASVAFLRSTPLFAIFVTTQVDHLFPSEIWESLWVRTIVWVVWGTLVASFIAAAFDREKRTIGDRIASTRVVKANDVYNHRQSFG